MLPVSLSVFKSSRHLYLAGVISVCVGLSLSKPLIGLGQLLLILAWIIEGNYKQRLKAFFSTPITLILISYYLITLIGLTYTTDFDFAVDDVRRKLPLFIFPFVLYGHPFTKNELKLIFKVYVAGVLVSSVWSIFVKFGGLGIEIIDVRNLSRFNSHIRFGLEICLGIFGAGYYWFRSSSLKEKGGWILVVVWLLIFMIIISLFTGLMVFALTAIILPLLIGHNSTSKIVKFLLVAIPIIVIVISLVVVKRNYNAFYQEVTPLAKKPFTADGHQYFHDLDRFNQENGYFVWRNNCRLELVEAWNKRSTISLDSTDLKGQPIATTLTRFITSKGWYKDREAVEKLTDEEVNAIENGIANYTFLTLSGVDKRIYATLWEYDNYINGGEYNGHSVMMRLEYWKTGIDIFKNNWFFGVGTGDIQNAFDLQYEKNNSPLSSKYRLRAHNQYITAAATFGIIGFVVFVLFLVYPMIKTRSLQDYLYLSFFIIITLSMLTEDTLDTQVGISFFAFFNALFLFNKKNLE